MNMATLNREVNKTISVAEESLSSITLEILHLLNTSLETAQRMESSLLMPSKNDPSKSPACRDGEPSNHEEALETIREKQQAVLTVLQTINRKL